MLEIGAIRRRLLVQRARCACACDPLRCCAMPQQALGGSSFIHEHVIQPAALLNSTEVEKLAHKEGTRRTVYFTKQVDDPNKKTSGEGAYRRTGQYLGEWHANEFDGKGVYELANGTRYVGGWQAGKRHGMGTTWLKGKKGELRKQYAGQWLDDARHGGVGRHLGVEPALWGVVDPLAVVPAEARRRSRLAGRRERGRERWPTVGAVFWSPKPRACAHDGRPACSTHATGVSAASASSAGGFDGRVCGSSFESAG